jgi:Enoyl-(Acyl carrier protein) reductase
MQHWASTAIHLVCKAVHASMCSMHGGVQYCSLVLRSTRHIHQLTLQLAALLLLGHALQLLCHCSPGFQKSQAEFAGKRVPIGRLGTTADIAYAAVYLCSDTAAGYVSGHTLVVDGAEVCTSAIYYYCSYYCYEMP